MADYASARHLVAEAFESFLPPDRVSVAAYAAQHRWLANEGGGYVGLWRHDIVPYLVEPMECMTDAAFLTVCVVGPGQSAKTSIAENWLLHSVATAPADMLWYMQTDDAMRAYVKQRINPMIESHEPMRSRQGLRAVDDSLGYKRFRGMSVQFLVAAHSSLISKSAPRIVADEIDAYPPGLGDVKQLLDVRRQTFGRDSKLLVTSHPDMAKGMADRDWTAGVMAVYAESDRRLWWWRCAECGAWCSPNPTARLAMRLEWPEEAPLDEIADAARLICPANGCVLEERHRRAMNLSGRWIGAGQVQHQDGELTGERLKRDAAGFWITGLMSPFVFGGIGGMARSRAKAEREREATGDDASLRQVVVKVWGLPYAPPRRIGTLDAQTLAERCDRTLSLGFVPDGVRFLTAFADVQADRFEVLVRGWGVQGESWVIAHERIEASPATAPDDWDALFVRLVDGAWALADGSGRGLRLRAAGIDSAGGPGVTQQAYAAWRRAKAARQARFLGTASGRECWSVTLTKGEASVRARRLTVSRPDHARADRKARASGEVPLASFNANEFKDALAGQLARAEPGPWHVHFPSGLLAPEPPHPFFEQLTAEQRKPSGAWEKTGARNEALDLMVGAHVIAHLHGVHRIDWNRPPPWAADWDNNNLVGPIAALAPPGAPPPAPRQTVPAAAAPAGAQRNVVQRSPRFIQTIRVR